MVPSILRDIIFANKLVDDNRSHLFTFNIPIPGNGATCSFLPPDFVFYFQIAVVIVIQSCINALLGYLVYKILVGPSTNAKTISSTQFLFAFGIGIPALVMEPIYIMEFLDIRNAGIRMLFLANTITGSLKIPEALYGFTPALAKKNLYNYIIYFHCPFSIVFDPITEQPKRANLEFFSKRLKTIGREFIIVSGITSILHEYGYEYFSTKLSADSLEHSLADLFTWQHLLNNFSVAVLISVSLSKNTLGVCLLYNIFYGYETDEVVLNPMFKSTSPSEFWGRRWNTLVHTCLKNGVYKPTRKYTSSKVAAAFAAFAVSGIIHEYVNLVMFANSIYSFSWKQMVFFGWNGVLVTLEYRIGHWRIFNWMTCNLPQIVITALVMCAALPLAHLFTGDWILHGYFDAVYLAEPILICR